MPIAKIQMPDGRIGRFEVPEGTTPEQAQSLISQQLEGQAVSNLRDYTVGEMASKALTRGAKQVSTAFGDIVPAMISKGLGFEEEAKRQMEEAAATQAEIQSQYAPEYRSYKDVTGPASALGYITESALEQVPNLATALVPGGIGAQVGRRAGLAAGERALARELAPIAGEELASAEAVRAAQNLYGPEAVAKLGLEYGGRGATAGVNAGIYLGSYAQNAPEVFQNIYDTTGQMEPGAALLAGAAAAGLDSALPGYLVKKFTGPNKALFVEKLLEKSGMEPSLARKAIATLPEAAGLEGLTESAQEAISISAEKYIAKNPEKFTSEDWNRILESGVKGAAAGLFFGIPGAVGSRMQERRDLSAPTAEMPPTTTPTPVAPLSPTEVADVTGLQGGPYGGIDTTGLGGNIPVSGQPADVGLPGAAQERVEPGYSVSTGAAGRPEGGAQEQPSPLATETAPATEITPAPAQVAEPATLSNLTPEVAAPAPEVTAEVTPAPSNLTPEAQTILTAAREGTINEDMLMALPRVMQENGIPPTRDKATGQFDDKIMLSALQDKEQSFQAAQAPVGEDIKAAETRLSQIRDTGYADMSDEDLDSLEQEVYDLNHKLDMYAIRKHMGEKAAAEYDAKPRRNRDIWWYNNATDAMVEDSSDMKGVDPDDIKEYRQAVNDFDTESAFDLGKSIALRAKNVAKPNYVGSPDYVAVRNALRYAKNKGWDINEIRKGMATRASEWGGSDAAELFKDLFKEASGKPQARPAQKLLQEARTEIQPSGETKESITDHLKGEFGRNIITAQNRGTLQIANTIDELPEEVRSKMAPNAVGAFHKGTSYLVADRMDKPTARRTLLHEVGEHHGLEGMLGKDVYKQVLRSLKSNKELNKDIAQAWDEVSRLYPELSQNDEQFLREVLAKVGENAPENTIWRRVVGAVKNFLTKLGLYNPNKFTTADIQDLILHSLRKTLKQPMPTPSRETQLGSSEALKRWFGNSKVVNEDGSPKVVYHGTAKDFNTFKKAGWFGTASTNFFTDNPHLAGFHGARASHKIKKLSDEEFNAGAPGVNIMPVYLSIQNPLVVDYNQAFNRAQRGDYKLNGEILIERAKKGGHDGLIIKNMNDAEIEGDVYVTFKQNQIKSAVGNVGTYSPDTDNIMYNKVDPKAAAQLLQSVGDAVKNIPVYNSDIGVGARAALSKVSPTARKIAMSFLSLPNKIDLYGDRLPQLKELLGALEQRASKADTLRARVDINTHKYLDILKKYPDHVVKKWTKLVYQLSNESDGVYPAQKIKHLDKEGKVYYTDNINYDPNNPLVRNYEQMPKDLQQLGLDIHAEYEKMGNDTLDNIEKLIGPGTKAALALRKRFEKNRLKFYHPLRRKGQYWASYKDKNGEIGVIARASPAERTLAIKQLQAQNATDFHEFTRLDTADYKQAPPVGFIADVIKQLDKQLNEAGTNPEVAEGIKNQVYQTYLDLLPAESLRQQFRGREGIQGYIEDVVGGYADTASKMANQLTNLEFRPKIDGAISDMRTALENYRREGAEDIEALTDVVQDMYNQKEFLDNPVVNGLAAQASWVSYFWNIAGNVSSALVNLTQLMMVVYPMLAGRFGWSKATSMMMDAAATYMKGGMDTNRKFMPDWTFGAKLNEGDKYYNLYQQAIKHSTMRRGVGYELTELRNRTADQFTGRKAKVETALSWIFQNSERANREITMLAAYDLAKESGMTEEKAVEYALDLTVRAHSHTLSEAGPKMFQTGFGKVAFTFKRFAQAQISNMIRLSAIALKGLDPAEQKIARKQLVGILGMTYAFSGLQGLPLYGAANMFASAMAALFGDDDEPYDFDEEVRNAVGMLGYKGPINLITNIDIASRTGFNGMIWRDDPRRLAEVGFAPYFAEHFFGPAYQALLVNPTRAYELFNQGHVDRALEAVTPTFIRSPMKAFRFATEGALTTNGAKIVDDVSAYNAFMQIFGFTNAELSEAYTRASAMKEAEKYIQNRRTALLDLAFLSRSTGDFDTLAEVREKIRGFNESHPAYRISEDTLKRSYRGHMQRIKDSVYGVNLNKKLKAELMAREEED